MSVRVEPPRKMSEGGAPQGVEILAGSSKDAFGLGLSHPYDHMYASNTVAPATTTDPDPGCSDAEAEVRFLREWLLLHLDLIQQLNDELLSKEKTIGFLKQENEMLKDRLGCLEKGATFTPIASNNHIEPGYSRDSSYVEMTQEVSHAEEDSKGDVSFVNFLPTPTNCIDSAHGTINNTSHELEIFKTDLDSEEICIGDDVSATIPITPIKQEQPPSAESSPEKNDDRFENNSFSIVDDPMDDSFANSSFVINSCLEDTLKHLRMNISRKRPSFENSADDSRKRKKRKRSLRDVKILTCNEQYVTQVGEVDPVEPEPAGDEPDANLEVPRWRVKVFTSCYSMEGTENLDDDVYNKRHLRLENDERRRKRWDVQRIREQRMIEKLKQRQERVGSGNRGDDTSEPVESLWPLLEDVKYLEVTDQLPVSAFGCLVPRLPPSEFSIPWLNNPHILAKRTNRKTGRRKTGKR